MICFAYVEHDYLCRDFSLYLCVVGSNPYYLKVFDVFVKSEVREFAKGK